MSTGTDCPSENDTMETNKTRKHEVPDNSIIYQVDKGERALADFTNQCIQSTIDIDSLESTMLFVAIQDAGLHRVSALLIQCFIKAILGVGNRDNM